MSGPVLAALVAAGLVAVADWIAVARDQRSVERIAKPVVIVCLLAAVALAGLGASASRWLLVAALVASLAGDWFLLPPVRFTAGLAAFLVAHLAYLALFLLGDLQDGWAVLGVAAAVVLLATAGRPILAGARNAGMGGAVGRLLRRDLPHGDRGDCDRLAHRGGGRVALRRFRHPPWLGPVRRAAGSVIGGTCTAQGGGHRDLPRGPGPADRRGPGIVRILRA